MNRIFVFIFLAITLSCTQVNPPNPVLPLPSERQLTWHEMEFYAFVHFNMNTFTNLEWGLGGESPELFNPTQLDCRQWARVCKEAGMKGIILTAKHHDGFCLWPSKYTEHSVKNALWKNGKGDVVRELADACKEYGLKMGIYLSPWDRNRADYGKPSYITYFRNQLRELLTNYGDIFEVWFDGANGGTGYYGGANEGRRIDRTTYYDWENTRKIVRELQPMACMFSDAGPDIRWCGNEQGWVRKTNWSLLKKDDFAPGVVSNIEFLRTGQEDGTHWLPAEVDVSIRPGWYYHPAEDTKVKSLPELLDIYYNSVGRNASFLLNLPVDRRGLIHETDVNRLLKFAKQIKADFANNLTKDATVTATNTRENSKKYSVKNLVDGNPDTYWATDDSTITSAITINFGEPTEFNRFLAQEYIQLGQRIKKFTVDASVNNKWKEIASETTIGRKRILRFPNVVASKLRLNILDAKACPVISNIGVYKAPKVLTGPTIIRDKQGLVTIKAFDSGLEIYYTLDGSTPSLQSTKYSAPFYLNKKATLKTVAVDPETKQRSPVVTSSFNLPKTKWKVIGEFASLKQAELIFDGNPNTAWTLRNTPPVDFKFDLGEKLEINGFNYLPDQGRWNPGIIFNYEFYVSRDGKNWGNPVSKGEFPNIKNSPILQEKRFSAVNARFVKFRALTPALKDGRIGIAEFGILTK
ncbi:MAG: alpha-L-fucosidase [Prolixibacteraceae bacterium]|nr:alpha-L-fucosidase [Prolixibacteraceae bacterium]